jgi:hypothetical protein
MRRALAIALLLLGAACKEEDPPTDFAGRVYPAECTIAATIAEPATRIPMDPDLLQAFNTNLNTRLYGVFIANLPGQPGTIFYDETLRGWLLADVMRHEGCHALWQRLKGDANWHPVGS